MRKLLLALTVIITLCAPVYGACGSTVTFGNIQASTGADITPVIPSHQTNDILILEVVVRDVDDTLTVSGWTQLGTVDRGSTSRYWWYGLRAASGATSNPVVDKSGATGDTYGVITGYRGCIVTETAWEVLGTPQTGTADPASLTSINTLSTNALVVVALVGEDNNNGAVTTTGTDPAAYTEHYDESTTGGDGMVSMSEFLRTVAGATGTISVNFDVANPVGWGALVMSLKSPQCQAGTLAMTGAGAC